MDPLVSHLTRQERDSLSHLVGSLSINDDNNDNNPSSSTTVSAEEVILSKSREGSLNDSDPSTTPTCSRSSTSTSTFVLFQPDCVKHRYVRNHHDLSEIVERPQRIKAIKAGVAAAYSKSENQQLRRERWSPPDEEEEDEDEDELGNLMKSLSIESNTKKKKKKKKEIKGETSPFDILVSHDTLSLDSPALNMIHGVPNYPPDYIPPPPSSRRSSPRKSTPSSTTPYPSTSPWPTQLLHLVHQTAAVTTTTTTTGSRRESEIPSHLPQGDLYLCRESDQAIFGALGAVCKGVDLVVAGVDRNTTTRRKDKGKEKEKETTEYENGFVVIRPPGHVSSLLLLSDPSL
jgi:histone deacetylase HOS3